MFRERRARQLGRYEHEDKKELKDEFIENNSAEESDKINI